MAIPITIDVPVEFTPNNLPAALQGKDPVDKSKHKFRLYIRVPTMLERDSYHAALQRAGVTHYSRQNLRDFSLAGVLELLPSEEQDEATALLEELWQVSDEETRVGGVQLERLQELVEAARESGGPNAMPDQKLIEKELNEIKPTITMDKRRRTKAASINVKLISMYEPLREALASLVEQDSKRHWMNMKTYVNTWVGLPDTPVGNGLGGLTQDEAEYLRGKLGMEAWKETSDFITGMQGIDEDEEKNLASLLESASAPIGSKTSEPLKASSENGNSTDAPSTKTRGKGSPKTTGSSSRSGKSSATKPAGSEPGQTAAG